MSKKDEILESVKALAVAGLPFILPPQGVALLTLANECFNSSGKLRQDKWNAEITSRIANMDKEIEQKIRETSNFASILASAQRGALEDMEEDKVALYANVVINSIKNESISDTEKHIFLNMLRDFTKLHIDTLKALSQQTSSTFAFGTNETFEIWKSYLKKRYPELLNDENVFDLVYAELVNLKMLNSNYVVYELLDNGTLAKKTTQLADEFLAFISEQEKAND